MKFFLKKDTGYFFFSNENFYYKIPISLNSFWNLYKEHENIKKVKIDEFYRDFLEESKYYYFFKKIKKYSKLSIKQNNNFINFYQKNFFKKKKKLKKQKIVNSKFFSNIKTIFKKEQRIINVLKKKFKKYLFLETHCHGDLYFKNILKDKNKIILIDWNNYQKKGSIYFDVINYLVFSKKLYKGSWYDTWKKNNKLLKKKYPKIYVNSYVLWKVSQDLDTQKINHRLIKKLKNIIKNFITHLEQER